MAVAFNYNLWFCSARLAFPYHNETLNPYWVFFDILSDVVNVTDIVFWQPRLQFVKAGDIIVSHVSECFHFVSNVSLIMLIMFFVFFFYVILTLLLFADKQKNDQSSLQGIAEIQGKEVEHNLIRF